MTTVSDRNSSIMLDYHWNYSAWAGGGPSIITGGLYDWGISCGLFANDLDPDASASSISQIRDATCFSAQVVCTDRIIISVKIFNSTRHLFTINLLVVPQNVNHELVYFTLISCKAPTNMQALIKFTLVLYIPFKKGMCSFAVSYDLKMTF